MNGYVTNIERDTLDNEDYRRVLFTGPNTAGIFTPMQIIVTCAARSSAAGSTSPFPIVARGPSPTEVQAAFAEAIDQSRVTSKPVYIRF